MYEQTISLSIRSPNKAPSGAAPDGTQLLCPISGASDWSVFLSKLFIDKPRITITNFIQEKAIIVTLFGLRITR
jgi:hypothetical protein